MKKNKRAGRRERRRKRGERRRSRGKSEEGERQSIMCADTLKPAMHPASRVPPPRFSSLI